MGLFPVQFAVVREDPEIERQLILAKHSQDVMLIASGGCTALSLQSEFPSLHITVVDPNPAQIQLIRDKLAYLKQPTFQERNARFNIGIENPKGFNECGNFESLFRCFRRFLHEFVLSKESLHDLFVSPSHLGRAPDLLFQNPYWPIAFDLFFHHTFLETMFGAEAVQHAPHGSYPLYFRLALEKGLQAEKALENYFLHHIFLGHYLNHPDCLPTYLTRESTAFSISFLETTIDQVYGMDRFDLVSLSNIFDWMSEDNIHAVANHVCAHMKPGSILLFRQLNHTKDFASFFPGFAFDQQLGNQLLCKDRSLFYQKINVGVKIEGVLCKT